MTHTSLFRFPLKVAAVFLGAILTLSAMVCAAESADARASVSPGRVEAKGPRFSPTDVPGRPGKPSWVWLSAEAFPNAHPTAALLRREIVLEAAPLSAQVWFSADAHARLYVNDRLVARGPDDGGQDYPGTQTGKWFDGYRDLTPFFQAGKNVIAAEVFDAKAMWGRYNTKGKGGFVFEAAFGLPGGKRVTLLADATWRGVPGECWSFPESGGLTFDGRREPQGWRTVGFDDSAWPALAPAATTWPEIVRSELPLRLEAVYPAQGLVRTDGPVRAESGKISFDGPGSTAVRFDRVLSGFISLKVRAAAAGTRLSIEPNEPNAPGHHRQATAILREGEQSFELPFYDSFSVINLKATGTVSIEEVRATFAAQPVRYAGAFSCNDEQLTRIWEVSRWLTQICQQTHHLDSPHHQEPICDPGDYLIIALNNYQAFGEPWLARQDLRKYAWLLQQTKYRPFHTSYALLWLQMLLECEDYTGDTALVKELAPTVHSLLDQFASYRGANGILSEAPDYMFMDWVTIAGFGCHHPPAVLGQGYLTAFFYRALADGIRVAALGGETARVARYEAMRKEIAAAYERELWDEKAGLYRDGKPGVTSVKPHQWLPADRDIKTHSTQNNVLAVLYDLAPRERQAAILRKLLAGDLNTQPYFMHFVFAALEHAGLFDEFAAAQMRRWQIVPDTQSFREMWGAGDYSHAWQCTPLFQMSGRVLGITPGAPGFAKVNIAPHPCDLAWARGSVPTPRGNVDVSWEREAARFTLDATIPNGTEATLKIPLLGKNPQLRVDGKSVAIRAGESLVAVSLGGGAHKAVLTFDAPPKAVPLPLETKTASGESAFEGDLPVDNLVVKGSAYLRSVEDKAAHTGGGGTADAIHNGTTRNGQGKDATADDARTFRGYGERDFALFTFDTAKHPRGFDLTGVTTFAGHADARASQKYALSIALVGDPSKFLSLGQAAVHCAAGSSLIRMRNPGGGVLENGALKATGVAAVRFDFENGPAGFSVYREIALSGAPTKP